MYKRQILSKAGVVLIDLEDLRCGRILVIELRKLELPGMRYSDLMFTMNILPPFANLSGRVVCRYKVPPGMVSGKKTRCGHFMPHDILEP